MAQEPCCSIEHIWREIEKDLGALSDQERDIVIDALNRAYNYGLDS